MNQYPPCQYLKGPLCQHSGGLNEISEYDMFHPCGVDENDDLGHQDDI
jgi:hypothetical protein